MAGTAWGSTEVQEVVDAYFAMLELELTRKSYVKLDHIRGVATKLDQRTRGSIEMKFQNVSAILNEEGIAAIRGYKPLPNYQKSLQTAVIARIKEPAFVALVESALQSHEGADLRARAALTWGQVRQPPPSAFGGRSRPPRQPPKRSRVDYGELEAGNRRLGLAGETFVLQLERSWLRANGRPDLESLVVHTSVEEGDGAGYDIASFEGNGMVREIEVKTTRSGAEAPFFLSAAELAFVRKAGPGYRLCRVYNWGTRPQAFELTGDQVLSFYREATQYRVHPRRSRPVDGGSP